MEALDAVGDEYQITPYPDEGVEKDAEDVARQEATVDGEAGGVEEDDAPEDERPNQPAAFSRTVSKNQSTNQWPALGSLSFEFDEDADEVSEHDSDEAEAMAYLRAVR